MSLSQLVCSAVVDVDVQLLNEDWTSPWLPTQYKTAVSLFPTHAHMYHSLRGATMCFRKDCTFSGPTGPDGHRYCPPHSASAIAPSTPNNRVSFGVDGDVKREADARTGVCSMPDDVFLTLIEQLRSTGLSSASAIVEELTNRFGGELLENAFHV